jgi:hypothetical protein
MWWRYAAAALSFSLSPVLAYIENPYMYIYGSRKGVSEQQNYIMPPSQVAGSTVKRWFMDRDGGERLTAPRKFKS